MTVWPNVISVTPLRELGEWLGVNFPGKKRNITLE